MGSIKLSSFKEEQLNSGRSSSRKTRTSRKKEFAPETRKTIFSCKTQNNEQKNRSRTFSKGKPIP